MPRSWRGRVLTGALAFCFALTSLPASAADPAPVVLAADTPQKTASGVTFTAPASWTLTGNGALTVVSAPETDLRIAIVEISGASDAKDAVGKAWALWQPGFKRPVSLATELPARQGWDARTAIGYETSPAEHVVVQAIALRKGTVTTVVLLDGSAATAEKRGAQAGLVVASLRPADYQRESFAGKPPHPLDAAKVAQLKAFLATSMEQLHIPGVAIALSDHGKIVYEGGVGVRNTTTNAAVDANTRFMVASNTKGMTTLMLAALVDRGKLRWDEPVVNVYPSFRLGDAAVTKSVLVKHLVCACTGLPRKDFDWLFNTTRTTPATQTFTYLAATAPTSKFGDVFQYNNLMATAAGLIGGHLAYPNLELGEAYDRAMQTYVFDPLGMTRSTLSSAVALADPNHADPYGLDIDGKLARDNNAFNDAVVPFRPAGGAWSTAHDMIRYVDNELTRGQLPNGKRVFSVANVEQRRVPTVAIGESGSYGMGLMVDNTYGIPIIHHGGDLPGYHSDWFAFPSAGIGAVILTNADEGPALRSQFMRRILELVYDGKPEAAENIASTAKRLAAAVAAERPKLTVPADSAVAATLAASYTSPELGPLRVSRDARGVVFSFNAFASHVATRKNDDGSVSFITIDPGTEGFEFVPGTGTNAKTLTLRDGQHVYVFTPGAST